MRRVLGGIIKALITVLVIAVPVVVALVLKSAPPPEMPDVEPRRANVEVMTVRRENFMDSVVLPMIAECPEDGFIKLSAEVAGRVVSIRKRAGDTVKQGETILEIDTESLRASLREAKAGYTEARLRHERTKRLYESKHVSKDQVDTVRAAFEQTSARLTLAEVGLKKGTVASPIDGTVDRRYVDAGEFVNVGRVVADVVNISRLYAVVGIPERDRQYVSPGMHVAVKFPNVTTGNPGRAYEDGNAVVKSVSDVGDEATLTYRTQIEFDNTRGLVKPGMLGTVVLKRRDFPSQVVVPNDYLVANEGETLVYLAVGGKAVARRVALGLTDGKRFMVLDGLRPGELIIREPRQRTPGELIRIRSIDGRDAAGQADPAAGKPPLAAE